MNSAAVVTQIKPLSKDPNFRRVYVNKRAVALLRASDVEKLHLREGMTWNAHVAAAVQSEHEALKARQAAMRMLGRRAYSRGELMERLVRRGHSQLAASRTVDELAADHWIDDARYAQEIVSAASSRKPASQRLLKSKLTARKIDPDTASEILSKETRDSDDAKALTFARQQLRTMKDLRRPVAASRIASKLARRGFEQQTIIETLEQIGLSESPGDQEQD
jgi:regulatory protein